jgi:hypothetical protein
MLGTLRYGGNMRTTEALAAAFLSSRSAGPESPPFAAASRALAEIGETGPEGLAHGELRGDLLRLDVLKRKIEALQARWLAEDHRRLESKAHDPVESSALWLQEHLHLSSAAAYAQVRVAERLERLPDTARAFWRGELTAQQVGIICRAKEQFERTRHAEDPELWEGVESQLHQDAQVMDATELIRSWRQMHYRLDQEAGVAVEEEQRRRSWLRLLHRPWGSYHLEGDFDEEEGTILRTALAPLAKKRSADDHREGPERMAHAVVDLARRGLDAGDLPERGGERPHLTVIAELETLQMKPGSRLAELDWGGLISGRAARRIAEDAIITPVLVDGRGELLHVGRATRSVSPRMRKALNLRDRRCRAPGCQQAAADCVPHHTRHVRREALRVPCGGARPPPLGCRSRPAKLRAA